MTTRMKGWQCVGCGRIEAEGKCIGICQDRPVTVVSAADYDALKAELEALRLMLKQIALTSPRNGEWERAYRATQRRAEELLAQG